MNKLSNLNINIWNCSKSIAGCVFETPPYTLLAPVAGGRLALLINSRPHNCEAGVRSPSPVVPLSKEPSTQLMGQKLRLRFVGLRAASRCCHRFTMPRLLWFMSRDCVCLSAINKACKLGGKPPYARRSTNSLRSRCLIVIIKYLFVMIKTVSVTVQWQLR